MGYTSLLSSAVSAYTGGATGGGGGGSGYGAGPTSVASGGTSHAAFGTVNFGAGASVGGTTDGDAGTGANQQNKILLYVGLGILALVAMVVLIKR